MKNKKMTIYKQNEILEDALFENPSTEYRGAPFWAWNGDLKEDVLLEQIEYFEKMGFGGAHMHIRTGMKQKYLGDEHLSLVKACCEKLKEKKMLSWLYDEDRWPSGAAGGYVTKDIQKRKKFLRLSPSELPEDEFRTLLAAYSVTLTSDGYLDKYSKISVSDVAGGDKWFAYLEIDRESAPWFNNQTYVDTLSKEAITAFVNHSYEAYYKTVGDEFGKTIPAIFTDEPQFREKEAFISSFDKNDVYYPWTTKLVEFYKEKYHMDILDYLPEVFWELPCGKISVSRYYLHDCIAEMFASSYADTIGTWCEKHNIMLTGHVMHEPLLKDQSAFVGEAMRSYRSFQLPGIDILCHAFEYTTAKQCQSAVHQYDRPAMLSELYGVTNWDFDFRGHKNQGDWQAALGVTVRVPHLAYYNMQGEAKRDYPASIFYQSPWYEKYEYIESHFARINTAMTRGKPVVRVGVIHPIESFWLHMGPNDKTANIREKSDTNFQNVTKWLLFSAIDFDFISEALLPSLCENGEFPLQVGAMHYDVIVVPQCETLRASTLDRLEKFKEKGGRIVFMGAPPTLCDAIPSDRGRALYDISTAIPFECDALRDALEDYRDISIKTSDGKYADKHIYQMREEDSGIRWLFVAGGKNIYKDKASHSEWIRITINGSYAAVYYDTLTGAIKKMPHIHHEGKTVILHKVYQHDSILLKLEPSDGADLVNSDENAEFMLSLPLSDENPFELSEDNVLVLDTAEYKLNDGEWQKKEEILRLDNECRRMLGWKQLTGRDVQPWVQQDEEISNFVTLKFEIESEIFFENPKLALENVNMVDIKWNGEGVEKVHRGFYIDRCLSTVELPPLLVGKNTLEVKCPIGTRVSLENMFLLGNFGVSAFGRETKIIALPEKLTFGDLRPQGLAFYGANVSYICEINMPQAGDLTIQIPEYTGSLVGVKMDGGDCGNIVFAPYELTIHNLNAGVHTAELTLYGNRFNTLGQLHYNHDKATKAHDTDELPWYNPASFRSSGEQWSYDYNTKPVGITETPSCFIKSTKGNR